VLFNGFDLDPADRREVDVLLERRVDLDEAVELTKSFASALATPGDRKRLIEEIETLLGDAEQHSERERELLQHVRAILSSHTVVDGLLEKLRGLFSRTINARPAFPTKSREERDRRFLEAVADDHAARDSDVQRVCAEYCQQSTMEERLRVLDALFRSAAEDHVITKREAEHVYRVAHLLWISNPEYHAIRDRYRDRIES
jgi:hypothetical protein